jgi:hypothetical protein
MLLNNLIRRGSYRELILSLFTVGFNSRGALSHICNLEVIVFAFVVVRKIPKDTNIFESKVVPLIVIRVIGDLIIM